MCAPRGASPRAARAVCSEVREPRRPPASVSLIWGVQVAVPAPVTLLHASMASPEDFDRSPAVRAVVVQVTSVDNGNKVDIQGPVSGGTISLTSRDAR